MIQKIMLVLQPAVVDGEDYYLFSYIVNNTLEA